MLSRFSGVSAFCLMLAVTPFLSSQEKSGDSPYFPLRVGNEWHYRWSYQFHEESKDKPPLPAEVHKVLVRVARLEELTRKEKNREEKIKAFVLESVQGNKVLAEQVAVLPDGVYRFAAAGKTISPPLQFLKLPPQIDQTWSCEATTNDTPIKGTFILGSEEVTVPRGKYKAIFSSCPKLRIGDEVMAVKYWFFPGVGIVKHEVRVGNYQITLELEDYKAGK